MELGQIRRDRGEEDLLIGKERWLLPWWHISRRWRDVIFFVTEQILDKHPMRRGSIIRYRCRFSPRECCDTFFFVIDGDDFTILQNC